MPVSFIHLSDIHFGQEKGGELETHNDVKERLLADATVQVKRLGLQIEGIIVTGDVAFAGKASEFKEAGHWLDRLANGVGCNATAVQVVPGNHDIDRAEISGGCHLMLKEILDQGEVVFDKFLNDEADCATLYRKLSAYWTFAEGYNCFLDKKGGIASNKTSDIAPGRSIRMMGLNSSLMCWSEEREGDLFLGARQRVLPINSGEELVILCHHPLHWLNDEKTARSYIRNRARVLMTGHEHKPAVYVDRTKPGRDFLTIASGAAIPPRATDEYGYTYNILTFDWDSQVDGLKVSIVPRTWSDGRMAGFEYADSKSLMALDEISRGARRWAAEMPSQMTAHTELSDERAAGFLHLRLKVSGAETSVDFLLPDLPGEWSTGMVEESRHDRLAFLERADVIWLMVDGGRLTELSQRQSTIHRTKLYLQRLKQFFPHLPRVILVITRADTGTVDQKTVDAILSEGTALGIDMAVQAISSFSTNPSVPAGTGIAELLKSSISRQTEIYAFWPFVSVCVFYDRPLGRSSLCAKAVAKPMKAMVHRTPDRTTSVSKSPSSKVAAMRVRAAAAAQA